MARIAWAPKTLSGFLATSVINGQDDRLLSGLAVVVFFGSAVGVFNALTVNHLRIPPIITTLAVGYILTTGTLLFNRYLPWIRLPGHGRDHYAGASPGRKGCSRSRKVF